MDFCRLVMIVGLLSGCAGSTSPDPDPKPVSAADSASWHLAFKMTGYDPAECLNAHSHDLSRVQLRGETCTDDGAECFDISNHLVEVWATAHAEDGAPFGVATWVSADACE